MNCERCGGACCEELEVQRQHIALPSADVRRWLDVHGVSLPGAIRLECRCLALTADGRCGIYEERPDVCRSFVPGGRDCLDTVQRRRTAEEYARIRGAEDPEAVHVG